MFPIRVNARGGLSWSGGQQRIEDAIWLIIATSAGERVMLPEFGAGANEYVFQPNSSLMRSALVTSIKHGLLRYEPRINLLDVRADQDLDVPSQVLITVECQIRQTNELFNVVFPLNQTEGAG
jgi:phage baseplate assembly protein W